MSLYFPESSGSGFLQESGKFDSCKQYARFTPDDTGSCQASDFNTSAIVACTDYVWDRSQWTESLTTINHLVCGNDALKKFSGTILVLGLLVGKVDTLFPREHIGAKCHFQDP